MLGMLPTHIAEMKRQGILVPFVKSAIVVATAVTKPIRA